MERGVALFKPLLGDIGHCGGREAAVRRAAGTAHGGLQRAGQRPIPADRTLLQLLLLGQEIHSQGSGEHYVKV